MAMIDGRIGSKDSIRYQRDDACLHHQARPITYVTRRLLDLAFPIFYQEIILPADGELDP
jgi:hypothetical protein